MPLSSVIIGGSSRSGKTWLANNIDLTELKGLSFDFELLFNVYIFYLWPKKIYKREKILLNYINRPRAVNPEKTKFSSPAMYLKRKEIKFIVKISSKCENILVALNSILNYICFVHNKLFWVGADYHAEHLYYKYKNYIQDLRLITCVRNPLEVVCASLYWRTYPNKIKKAEREINKRIFLWKSSILFGNNKSKSTLIINMNKLVSKNHHEIKKLYNFFVLDQSNEIQIIKNLNSLNFWFSKKNEKFLSPSGNFEDLLTKKDIYKIDRETKLIWNKIITNKFNDFFILKILNIKLRLYFFYLIRFYTINFKLYFNIKKLLRSLNLI